jgi:glutamate-ammonia-ligase adenylyltransferase
LIPTNAVDELRRGYVYLRNLEHRLQYRDDQQTQQLPDDDGERNWLAEATGARDRAAFERELDAARRAVSAQFAVVLGTAPVEPDANPFASVWSDPGSELAQRVLADAGYADAAGLLARLRSVQASSRYHQLPALSRQRFDQLVPQLLDVAARAAHSSSDAQSIFTRLLDLLESVSRRSAYLALLIEHPPLLPRLANLMGASAWAADYLTRHPLLLDELLDARLLLAEPDWEAWRRELAAQLRAAGDDPEEQMDALRHFQQAQTFRLLSQDLAGQLTVERLADHLSALADVVLEATLAQCWRHLRGVDAAPPRFAVIGYGKLGGKELGYASDLDLVFIYDVDSAVPDADTEPVRYARLAQRIITWLTSTTAAGQLYDADLRLRPDGAAGLIVSSLGAFRKYQREHAWTWEHQALTRARFVAGDADIGRAFESERETILRLPRDAGQLAADVVDMRRKMHAGHANPTPLFDLKHDPGGMVDIEFTVQYLVLAHAHAHPQLTRNAGNIALVRMAGELGLVPAALAQEVADAYRAYRRQQHAVRLTGAAQARVDAQPHAERRAAVDALWRHVFGTGWRT